MLNSQVKSKRIVAAVTDAEEKLMKAYIKGAVYCFCKICPEEYFAARDLFGGDNKNWEGTPLQKLYDWHENNRKDDASEMAAKDLGYLLLSVICEDDVRTFDTRNDYVREYKWVQ